MAFSVRKRKGYTPPPPPPDDVVEAVREVEQTAELQLQEARAREPDIDARARKVAKIRQDNELGPRFWRAVGGT